MKMKEKNLFNEKVCPDFWQLAHVRNPDKHGNVWKGKQGYWPNIQDINQIV